MVLQTSKNREHFIDLLGTPPSSLLLLRNSYFPGQTKLTAEDIILLVHCMTKNNIS